MLDALVRSVEWGQLGAFSLLFVLLCYLWLDEKRSRVAAQKSLIDLYESTNDELMENSKILDRALRALQKIWDDLMAHTSSLFKFLTSWFKWFNRDTPASCLKKYDQQAKQNSETRKVIHNTRNALDTLILELNKKKASSDG